MISSCIELVTVIFRGLTPPQPVFTTTNQLSSVVIEHVSEDGQRVAPLLCNGVPSPHNVANGDVAENSKQLSASDDDAGGMSVFHVRIHSSAYLSYSIYSVMCSFMCFTKVVR